MNTLPDFQLSSELQDLYLQNKQWFSDVLFLEDESRFFRKIFGYIFSSGMNVKGNYLKKMQQMNTRLSGLEDHRVNLKKLLIRHHQLLESLLEDPKKPIGLELIEENAEIVSEIKALFLFDSAIKKELYTLMEGIIRKEKASHLLN